ncbi:hypothetical protein Golax_021674 [Gossypium laxum]|uniref:Pentatricopeptide repeat-containing protein n=1 Tax=Gossypium laxum TaxID=34288 RepID=A0A7J9ALV3_9ROSI|nr:hypothetical protein [Gossypium laxum]
MVNKRISPNVYTLNTIISALCKDGKIQEAIFVFDLMSQRGTRPDEGQSSEAIEILELMTRKGVKPIILLFKDFVILGNGKNNFQFFNQCLVQGKED